MSTSHAPLPSPSPSDSGDEQSPLLSQLELNISDKRADISAPYERKLGDSELSYYLPGRATGVNDMYLHLGLTAPERLMHHDRVLSVWTILRLRHPLLASHVVMDDYENVRFVYIPTVSSCDAKIRSAEQLRWECKGKDGEICVELIDDYLNGPRTLSNSRLSFLVISRTPNVDPYPSPPGTPQSDASGHFLGPWEGERVRSYEWLMCAAHFIGDGIALHNFANDFFTLLGAPLSDHELHDLVVYEWETRWRTPPSDGVLLPPSFEESIPSPKSRMQDVVGHIDFQALLQKQIGGHSFPRCANPVRHTIVPTLSFDEGTTKAMLNKCKAENVSIAAAVFAICNIVWARMSLRDRQTLPTMVYAAMNIRPSLMPRPKNDSYWFLAVGYFNVVLPSFIPSGCDTRRTFWHRARSAKTQIIRAATTPMLLSRCREMSIKRGRLSRAFAHEDDEKENGAWVGPRTQPKALAPDAGAASQSPSTALLGLSMLGNLDAVYKHATFADIKLQTLTTGSRQRHGGMLLFGYTFAGKLWVSLGYDENGFEPKPVRLFWDNMISAMHEFLLESS
ncbi:hypothetical protein K488DRAFT_52118 [Vararia minispora EC-137]|uniref:Uncharacterized protein n=1 Tax=Vararia minispora EC-137 TaxID=1314806 RepID=A0ACB8QIK8_9AGAM|nr:hypothetical protein K488DRAFT_52118 [Vararia minispora EC-137]